MRYTITAWIKSVGAVALATLLLGVGACMKGFALAEIKGDRTYYLHSASSWAAQTSTLSILELPFIEGESVRLQMDGAGNAVGVDEVVAQVLQTYGARVQFIECVDGAVSYYCFSLRLPKRVWLRGRAVNLHIAVAADKTAAVVGYPIIFGGF